MSPDKSDKLGKSYGDYHEKKIDRPTVVIKELERVSDFNNFGKGNEESGYAVENKNRKIENKPEFSPEVLRFVEIGKKETEISIGQNENSQKRNVVPEVYSVKKLGTHSEGTAVPKDHDCKKHHERTEDFFSFLYGCKGKEKEKVTEYRDYGDPTISTH
jgi:hypothetical protein